MKGVMNRGYALNAGATTIDVRNVTAVILTCIRTTRILVLPRRENKYGVTIVFGRRQHGAVNARNGFRRQKDTKLTVVFGTVRSVAKKKTKMNSEN